MLRGYFVTGTDTSVGKTFVCQALLRHLRDKGIAAVGFKPVASGCEQTLAGLRSADAMALQQESVGNIAYARINPYALATPVAPHLAAEDQHVQIDLSYIHTCIHAVTAEFVIVEGVGGWRVPLNAGESVADLAERLALPVILVVGMRLGCLNHALHTAEAIRAQGVPLAGWVANHIDPAFAYAERNVASLENRLGAPLLARLPWDPELSVQAAADQMYLGV